MGEGWPRGFPSAPASGRLSPGRCLGARTGPAVSEQGVVHFPREWALSSAADAQLIWVSLPLRGQPQTGPAAAARETARAKPLPPRLMWPKIHLISCLDVIVKIATCFLNFRITVDKSISQPLVIGVSFSRK